MAHSHEVKKIKGEDNRLSDKNASFVVFENSTPQTISFGKPSISLYPKDTAVCCSCHPSIDSAVKAKKITILVQKVTENISEPKKKEKQVIVLEKTKEEETQETFETVADTVPSPSVQLDSSDDGETLSSDAL